MNDTTETLETKDTTENVSVDSLDLFYRLLVSWHSGKVEMLEHVMDVPEGTPVVVNLGDGKEKELILEGDVHAAFISGITLALMEMGTLPFTPIQEDVVACNAAESPLQ